MHTPVLLKEVIDGLALEPGLTVVDGTVGNAGHARAVGERLGPTGRLIGLDLDQAALKEARHNLSDLVCRVDLVQANFRDLAPVLDKLGVSEIDRFLLDLGLRSDQLEGSGRGFSFLRTEPLLMTFASGLKPGALTAYEIVNSWPEAKLVEILFRYGEERAAHKIAKVIVQTRRQKKIETSVELANLVSSVVARSGKIHPATKTFQALRITVNDELESFRAVLPLAWDYLKPTGRLAVITFQGLEAKIIKNFIRLQSRSVKIIKPQHQEILKNPRARSAQLRIMTK